MNTGTDLNFTAISRREYDVAREKADKNKADLEYYRFQLSQLEAARLIKGEQEDLEKEQEMLSHAEEIKSGLTGASELCLIRNRVHTHVP